MSLQTTIEKATTIIFPKPLKGSNARSLLIYINDYLPDSTIKYNLKTYETLDNKSGKTSQEVEAVGCNGQLTYNGRSLTFMLHEDDSRKNFKSLEFKHHTWASPNQIPTDYKKLIEDTRKQIGFYFAKL